MKMHTVLWTNYDVQPKYYADVIEENYPEATEEEKQEIAEELNWEDLNELQYEFDKDLPEDIIILATLGLWDGKHHAYKEMHSNNLQDCFYLTRDCGFGEFYVDSHKNLRSRQSHHDGTNYYCYRMWKEGLSDTQKQNFLEKVYQGKETSADISRYTKRLGDLVLW